MRKILSLLIFVLVASTLKSQIFSGRVTDKEGRAVPHASLFISEIKSGISADASGEFSLKILPEHTVARSPLLVTKGDIFHSAQMEKILTGSLFLRR